MIAADSSSNVAKADRCRDQSQVLSRISGSSFLTSLGFALKPFPKVTSSAGWTFSSASRNVALREGLVLLLGSGGDPG